jgi:glycosyltransferase involved in cell wall biosynthesis
MARRNCGIVVKISMTGLYNRDPYRFNAESVGYGKVGNQVLKSLQRHGIDISLNNPDADVVICCDDRNFLTFEEGKYNIVFTTHESSELFDNAIANLRKADEVWTMNEWIREGFAQYVDSDILVAPTCISKQFIPLKRSVNGPFVFLHIGEPSPRKNGQMVLDAFKNEFGNNPDFMLVFKTYGIHNIAGYKELDNIIFINYETNDEEYVTLLNNSHCLVYPSTCCGGGMMPLEAMATGMPIISVSDWADYKKYVHLPIKSDLSQTPDYILAVESSLRGCVFNPKIESLQEQMRNVYENYNHYSEIYYSQAKELSDEYDWDKVVEERIIPRLKEIEKTI